jgi:hypothetical protein
MDAIAPAQRDGQAGADGRAAGALDDPAHGGALPDATFPQLVGRMINDVSDLADRQVELAKQEINEARDEAIGVATTIGIGAAIGVVAALFLAIWAWTAVIWFFNWLGAFVTVGPVTFAWVGWIVGVVGPIVAAWLGYKWFITRGIERAKRIWPALPRTRETLREDLEWVQRLRTRNAR